MQYHYPMTKADNVLGKMKNNPPGDWQIDQLKTVAKRHGIEWRQQGTSHVVFVRQDGRTLPVPASRPIKPIYVKKFLALLEE